MGRVFHSGKIPQFIKQFAKEAFFGSLVTAWCNTKHKQSVRVNTEVRRLKLSQSSDKQRGCYYQYDTKGHLEDDGDIFGKPLFPVHPSTRAPSTKRQHWRDFAESAEWYERKAHRDTSRNRNTQHEDGKTETNVESQA